MRVQQLPARKPDEERIYRIKTSSGKGVPSEQYDCHKTDDDELTCFQYTEYPDFKEPRHEFSGRVSRDIGRAFLNKWRQFRRLIMSDEVEGVDESFVAFEIEFTRPKDAEGDDE